MRKTLYFCVLTVFLLVFSCEKPTGPTVKCSFGEEEILPSTVKLDASSTTPFNDKFELKGFIFSIEKPDGKKEIIKSDSGIIDFKFSQVGVYKIDVYAADSSGIANKDPFSFEMKVKNPFENVAFSSSKFGRYFEGEKPLFSIEHIEDFSAYKSIIKGCQWTICENGSDQAVAEGTGLNWKSLFELKDLASDENADYNLSLTLTDSFGNEKQIMSDLIVISKESPDVNFSILHLQDPLDSSSDKVDVLDGGLYEYETIFIETEKIKASSVAPAGSSVSVSELQARLYYKDGENLKTVDSFISENKSGFSFNLKKAGVYQLLLKVKNSLGLCNEKSLEFSVALNTPVISNVLYSAEIIEGQNLNFSIEHSSPSKVCSKISRVLIDFDKAVYEDKIISLDEASGNSLTVEAGIFTEVNVKKDFNVAGKIYLFNEINNISEGKDFLFKVKDNTPVADISVVSEKVFFGSEVLVDISGCSAELVDDSFKIEIKCVSNNVTIELNDKGDKKYSFIPQDPDSSSYDNSVEYFVTVNVGNSVGSSSSFLKVTAIDGRLLPSFYIKKSTEGNNFYAGESVIIDASASIDGSKPVHEKILDESYIWEVFKDGVEYVSGYSGTFTDNSKMSSVKVDDVVQNGMFSFKADAPGLYLFKLKVKDKDGQLSTDVCEKSVAFADNVPESVVITSGIENIIESDNEPVTKEIEYKFSASAVTPSGQVVENFYWFVDRLPLDLDSNDGVGKSISLKYSVKTEQKIYAVAVNSLGEKSVGLLEFVSDSLSVPFVTVNKNFTNTKDISFSWTPSQPDSVDAYRFRFGNENNWRDETGDDVLTFQPLESDIQDEGSYFFFIQEKKNNIWSNSAAVEVVYDITAPAVPELVKSSELTNDGKITGIFSWSAGAGSDASVYSYTLDDPDSAEAVWVVTESLQPGVFQTVVGMNKEADVTLSLKGGDKAGNWSAPVSAAVHVDRIAPVSPVVSTFNPTPEYANSYNVDSNGCIAFNWEHSEISDVAEFVCIFNSGDMFSINKNVLTYTPESMVEGDNILSIQAKDAAGNLSLANTITVKKDIVAPPHPAVTVELDGVVYKTNFTTDAMPVWKWSCDESSEEYSAYRYKQINIDSEWKEIPYSSNGSLSPSFPFNSDGKYEIVVQSKDKAGNWSGAEDYSGPYTEGNGYLSINLDRVAPVITIPSSTVEIEYSVDGNQLNNYLNRTGLTASDAATGDSFGDSEFSVTLDAPVDSRKVGTYSNVIKYVISDGLGNTAVAYRDAVVKAPVVFEWNNGGFESNKEASPGQAGGLFPDTADTAGWLMEEITWYRIKKEFGWTGWSDWMYLAEPGGTRFNWIWQNYSDTNHFVIGGCNAEPRTGSYHFKVSGYRIYQDDALNDLRIGGASGRLVYGFGKVGDVDVDRSLKVYKDVVYKITGYIKAYLGMNSSESQAVRFYVENVTANPPVKISESEWFTYNSNQDYHARTLDFTPSQDCNIRFVVEIQEPSGGYKGMHLAFDDFSAEIVSYPVK